jgi:hypothetical protein
MIQNQPCAAALATTTNDNPGDTGAHLSAEPDLKALLAALGGKNSAELRQSWRQVTGRPAPRLGAMLLRHALAWEMQAQVYGGLSSRTRRRLAQHANGAAQQQSSAGLTLVREWKGVLHTVTVDQDEVVHWNGKTWNSLSEVARAITGTRWSGPRFFGLIQEERGA